MRRTGIGRWMDTGERAEIWERVVEFMGRQEMNIRFLCCMAGWGTGFEHCTRGEMSIERIYMHDRPAQRLQTICTIFGLANKTNQIHWLFAPLPFHQSAATCHRTVDAQSAKTTQRQLILPHQHYLPRSNVHIYACLYFVPQVEALYRL